MIYFHIPEFYYFYKMNIRLIDLLNESPNLFRPNIAIGSVYGAFPSAIWNGGRFVAGEVASLENINETILQFNERGVPVRFTWTNPALSETDKYDRYCNIIMQCADGKPIRNQVLCNLPFLEDYLRENFPKFDYISSTTKMIRDKNGALKEICNEGYKIVVLDFDFNKDISFLRQLPHPEKIELLADDSCSPHCPLRAAHYYRLGETQLWKRPLEGPPCKERPRNFFDRLNYENTLLADDIYSLYSGELGIHHFKLAGRTANIYDVIESYVYYLVKPEHKDVVRLNLLESI